MISLGTPAARPGFFFCKSITVLIGKSKNALYRAENNIFLRRTLRFLSKNTLSRPENNK